MKYLLTLLSVAGLVLLVTQFTFVVKRTPAHFAAVRDIKAFDGGTTASSTSNTTRFDSLFNKLYLGNKVKVEQADNNGFVTHLIVIILTAFSTLVSTIGAIKGGATPKPIYLMIVAGLTFLATVSGAIESRFTEKKNGAVNRQQKLLSLEASFSKDWTAAAPDKKDEVEATYIRNLLVIPD